MCIYTYMYAHMYIKPSELSISLQLPSPLPMQTACASIQRSLQPPAELSQVPQAPSFWVPLQHKRLLWGARGGHQPGRGEGHGWRTATSLLSLPSAKFISMMLVPNHHLA